MRKYISDHKSELEECIFPYVVRNEQQSYGSPSSGVVVINAVTVSVVLKAGAQIESWKTTG